MGSVAASADGVCGLVISGAAVTGKLELGKTYVLYSPDSLDALGITGETNDPNVLAYQCVQQFYAEAGNGAELWLMVMAASTKASDMLDPTKDNARKLVRASGGRVRTLAAVAKTGSGTTEHGLDADVWAALAKGQLLGEWATDTLYAPIAVLIEGKGYANGSATDLTDLGEGSQNRVGIVVGQPMAEGTAYGSLVAVALGRVAKLSVQTHIGRVRDGALTVTAATVDGTVDMTDADVDTLNNKGYITLTTYVGRSGYFFCDDHLATSVKDDYHSLARRRVVDKAYRIAYDTLLDHLKEEVACNSDGTIVAAVAKAWEADVVTAVYNQMTSNGELGSDPADSKDKGVRCTVDTVQNVVSTSKVKVTIGVKPYGYAKYIEASLGFTAIES